jgi:hypothetical protein
MTMCWPGTGTEQGVRGTDAEAAHAGRRIVERLEPRPDEAAESQQVLDRRHARAAHRPQPRLRWISAARHAPSAIAA